MKFVFPICKADGSEYKSQSEIESILKQEHVGQFGYNPSNFSWHGGVHFTAKNVPWAKDNYPVRAIADGKIIACRLSSKYQETTYKDFNKELTLPFSHDFCLIEHEFLSKDETGTETKFVFYSLYMHLDPINFHQSLSPTKLYKFINGGWYGREFPGVNGPKTLLSANTILKRITSEPEVQIETNIFKLYEVVDNAGNKDALAKVGKRLRVAAPDDHFEMVDEKFPQAPKPNWMYKSTSESGWESIELDSLHNLGANSTLQVKAGDSIGYLGRFDVLNPKSSTGIDSRYQVHFEVFSNEKPPKQFLEAITNKDDLTKISYISDLNSDGFCDPENPREFFAALANNTQSAATLEQEITTPEDIVKHLSEWDANKFTIVQHESEWHDKAESKSIFDTLLQMFQERDLELPFKLEHEKQRVNQLIWMQDVGIGKHVWSWWPVFNYEKINICNCKNIKVNVTKYNGILGPVVWGNLSLNSVESAWLEMKKNNLVTDEEVTIIKGMSKNEGNLDAVQSYDSELITAGAMQKTTKLNGKGELTTQIIKFKELHENLYKDIFESHGWIIENDTLLFQHSNFNNGVQLQGNDLRRQLRSPCSSKSIGDVIECYPIASLSCAVSNAKFIEMQLSDFVTRLRFVKNLFIPNYNIKISDLFTLKLGLACCLDHHINRPAYVIHDLKSALDVFFLKYDSISSDFNSWKNEEHLLYQREILNIYGNNRRMTDAKNRYNKLVREFL